MKKILFFAVVLCMVAGTAAAGDMTGRIGLGFTTTDAPIGMRYWFSPKMGVDVGVGFFSTGSTTGGDRSTDFAVAGALPINIHRSGDDRVNFNFLPGVEFYSEDAGSGSNTYIDLSAMLEFEAFVTQDLSVSAAHGIVVTIYNPDDPALDSATSFYSSGSNLTEFGVHYYLPGK